jgi:hypothetical protein
MQFSNEKTAKSNKNIENSQEKKKVVSFETEKGSVYTYQKDGSIQRYKASTGETFNQSVVAFIPSWDWLKKNAPKEFLDKFENELILQQEMLRYIHQRDGEQMKVWLVDEKGNKIDNADQLNKAKRAFLYFGDEEKNDFIFPVFSDPKKDSLPFDTSKYKEKDDYKRHSHIGNKIVKINYEK